MGELVKTKNRYNCPLGLEYLRTPFLWNRWNADLGIVPANRSLSLAVELWSGQLREFYDLLLDFIAHRLELSRDKNGSIEVQKLGSFSATSFDRLLLTSKKRIIPFLRYSKKKKKKRTPLRRTPFRSCSRRRRRSLPGWKNDPRSSWRRVLHELGHAHYYLAYDNASLFSLYKSDRGGGNSASGRLSGGFKRISQEDSPKSLINRLLSEAVTSFVRLPYALSLERWRHELMTGEEGGLSVREMNSRYWEIREEVSRVKAPENDER
ncbi:Angiotensin-converting enzyme [Tyrophagus putrescentiae]|nr:Angiotensin-converting enzyme [Tyrophagus putrescentiae]